jgi:hypothetical protein
MPANQPRRAIDLEPYELREIVDAIQETLWQEPDFDEDGQFVEAWNPDKEWECADYLPEIATLLENYGLKPSGATRADAQQHDQREAGARSANQYLVPRSVTGKLTAEEYDAILRVASMLGKRWKSIVRAAWARGNYNATGVSSDDYWALQSIRNKLSPGQFSRLHRFEC